MRVTVEFYGVLRQLTGETERALELTSGASVVELYAALGQRYPDLRARLAATACAAGDTLVPRHTVLSEGQRLALIPPVSGG